MAKNILQYLIDPFNTQIAEALVTTAEQSNLDGTLEVVRISYNNEKFLAYRVSSKEFFELVYQSRKKIRSNYNLRKPLRFFERKGEDGPISLLNAREIKNATERAVSRSIKLTIGNKKISEGYLVHSHREMAD